jgi:hypothetical protein
MGPADTTAGFCHTVSASPPPLARNRRAGTVEAPLWRPDSERRSIMSSKPTLTA